MMAIAKHSTGWVCIHTVVVSTSSALIMSFKSEKSPSEEELLRERQDKITQYESYINERLKVDLQLVLQQRDEVYKLIGE